MRIIRFVLAAGALAIVSWPIRADLFANSRDPATGSSFPTVVRYGPQGQFLGAFPAANPPRSEELNSITRGPDGKFYFLTNILGTGNVLRINPTGAGSVEGAGNGASIEVPRGIAFDNLSRLYVGSSPQIVPGSTHPTAIYRPTDPTVIPWLVLTGVRQLGDIECDPAGDNLFVGVPGEGIRQYSISSQLPGVTIPAPAVDNFRFGPDGKLYVGTPSSGILKYDPTTGASLGAFVAPGSGGLIDAYDMTFGDDGYLYVNSTQASKILRYDANTGAFADVFTTYTGGPLFGVSYIAYAPEPGAACAMGILTGFLLIGRRHDRRRNPQDGANIPCGISRVH